MLIKPKFGSLLLKNKVITEEILSAALNLQKQEKPAKHRKLGLILVEDFNIDHDAVYRTQAEFYAFKKMDIDINTFGVKKQLSAIHEILSNFPDDLKFELFKRKILPYQISLTNNSLVVLASDVLDEYLNQISRQTIYKKVEVVYCNHVTLEQVIEVIKTNNNEFLNLLQEAGNTVEDMEETKQDTEKIELDNEINQSLLVSLFEGALMEAVRKKASDIHIIPHKKNSVDFFFRIDGKLIHWHRQDNTSPEAMAAVVKDRTAGVDRFERDTAQDGFAQRKIDGYLIRFRISIIPIISTEYERRFESIVIRVIDDRNVITNLKKLGLQQQAEKDFVKAISVSKGIILLTGPTGSGKSTTLMAALHHIITPSKNVLTCEDPVEYVIEGARQIKIGNKLTFEEAIRAILRHDPDIVMVGEIRDKITAEVAVKLANTGHLTFSTLHTNDAPSAISRLYKMGVEPFLLAYSINIIVAQRLVRKLCPVCRRPLSKEKHEFALELGLTQQDLDSGNIYEQGKGCKNCLDGFKSRLSIVEALYLTPKLRRAIMQAGTDIDEEEIRRIASKNGMLSLRESGMDRVRNGLTTIEEIAYSTSEV